ncbi:hypothetical protein [Streptomyces sp. SAS_275]|uniref:hypothetical protein n=1 Tax=Streptomyces sp. SAS_275 TaxID=3412746 RepID=UPI00403CB5AE
MERGEVDGGGLVVASGQATPLLELVAAALDGVLLSLGVAVEGRRAAAESVEPLAVGGIGDRDRAAVDERAVGLRAIQAEGDALSVAGKGMVELAVSVAVLITKSVLVSLLLVT